MDYFYKMYYNIKSIEDRDKIAKERYNYHSTIRTGLETKPIDQDRTFELFYIPTNKLLRWTQKITLYDKN